MISGWFESEYGVDFVAVYEARNQVDLVSILIEDYGMDIVGVDLELEGEYTNGTEISNVSIMAALLNGSHLWDNPSLLASKEGDKT